MPYNLLWIIADQLRQDGLGCYGNRMIQTPHLDHLASEASVLENVQVANPLCMPSRATLISGLYPHQHGVWNNGVPLSDWVPTLANVFASYNYHTFAIGKLHFTPNAGPYVPGWADNRTGWQQGLFDAWSGPYFGFNEVALTLGHNFPGGHYGQYLHEKDPSLIDLFQRTNALEDHGTPESWVSSLNEEHHASWWIARRTVEALSRMQHEDRSFFGWVSFPDPHHPFVPPMPYAKLYDPVDVPLPVRRVGELDDKPEHFRRYFEGRMIHEGIGRQGFNPSAITEPQIREIIAHTYGQITLLDRAVGYILDYLRDSGFDDKTVIVFSSDHGELLGDHGLLFKGPFLYEPLTRIPCLIRVPGFGPQRNTTLFSSADLAPSLLSYIGLPLPESMLGRSRPLFCESPHLSNVGGVLTEYRSSEASPRLILKSLRTARHRLTWYVGSPEGELYDLYDDPFQFVNRYHDPHYTDIRSELMEQLIDTMGSIHTAFHVRTAHA